MYYEHECFRFGRGLRFAGGGGLGGGPGGGRGRGMGRGPMGGGHGMGAGPMGHGPGLGGGMGGRRGEVRRYLEPSLLLLLKDKEAHGYELMEKLDEVFPRPTAAPDASTLYRILTRLELEGAVTSRWEGGDGAGRKVYTLTEQGREILAGWVEAFREEHRRLGRFLERYDGKP